MHQFRDVRVAGHAPALRDAYLSRILFYLYSMPSYLGGRFRALQMSRVGWVVVAIIRPSTPTLSCALTTHASRQCPSKQGCVCQVSVRAPSVALTRRPPTVWPAFRGHPPPLSLSLSLRICVRGVVVSRLSATASCSSGSPPLPPSPRPRVLSPFLVASSAKRCNRAIAAVAACCSYRRTE